MATGEITRYYAAAKAIEGQRVAADSFEDVNIVGSETKAEPVRDTSSLGFVISDRQAEAQMGKTSGAIEGVGKSGQALAADKQKRAQEKTKNKKDDTSTLLAILDAQIADIENNLAAKYGENFAMDIFEELVQEGKIDEETAKRIRGMQDVNEQRREAALEIQKGVKEGRIDIQRGLPADPKVKLWLDKHQEAYEIRSNQANAVLDDVRNAQDANADGIYEAASHAKNTEQTNDIVEAETDKKAVVENQATNLSGFDL